MYKEYDEFIAGTEIFEDTNRTLDDIQKELIKLITDDIDEERKRLLTWEGQLFICCEIPLEQREDISMEKIVSKIAALGVPGLILITAMSATGYAGGAALTTALSAIGPGGMLLGIATLGVIGLISEGLTEFGFDVIFAAVIKELYKKGESKESISRKIEKYPVSKSLKRKLKEKLEKV